MMPRRIRFALAGAVLALFVVLAALAGILLPEARPAAAHTATITAISITSTPASGDTYGTSEDITVRVTFNTTINGISSGRLRIGIGSNTRTVNSNTNSPLSTNVDFTYRVVVGDVDADGITVATNALSGIFRHQDGGGISSATNYTLPSTLATAQAAHKVKGTVDYDADDDNLIDITTLAQLNAIRHDLDGNGNATHADYVAAFPNRETSATGRMGCAATCAGYELLADLDFDTDGDDDVDSNDAYPNWSPLGTYTSTFQGNGHTISNLTISSSAASGGIGLFTELGSSSTVTALGLFNPSVSTSGYSADAGALAHDNSGTINAVYVSSGAVSATGNFGRPGGLVSTNTGTIRASYSTAAVSSGGTFTTAGGLVTSNVGGTIIASYAAGSVSATAGQGVLSYCLAPSQGTITNSYWSTGVCTLTGGGGAGQSASALQSPTAYGTGSSIYLNWNVNVDGNTGNDDPWDFGTSSQYPILQFGRDAVGIQAQRNPQRNAVDYDGNDNNLIDITTLARLDAMRYDLDGDGASVKGAGAVKYANAFPGVSAGMGCAAACIGYELRQNLDFNTGQAARTDDAYYNGGAGWTPIGTDRVPFSGTFRGNGHTLSNLHVNSGATIATVGLFGTLSGAVTGIGLPNASVTGAADNTAIGALTGTLGASGTVTSSWATGSVASSNAGSAAKNAGGLVGFSYGTVRASYADVTVTASNTATNVRAGGLVGSIGTIVATGAGSVTASYATGAVSGGTSAASYVGGLVGQLPTSGTPTITASYSTGTATSGANANTGGLAGNNPSGAVITDSYWDTDSSGIADADPTTSAGAGQTTANLQSPAGYTGIYANWNVDVGGTSANDNPWDFGYDSQYPALKYDGLDVLKQGRDTILLSTDALDVNEDTDSATYTVRLGGRPNAAVTVTVASDNADVTIDGPDAGAVFSSSETLSFSTTNWNTAQTVTVKAASDANLANESVTLSHTAAGASSGFAGVTASVTVTVTDDDAGSILLTQNNIAITALTVDEEGSNVTYDVALSHQPTGAVTVTVAATGLTIDGPDAGAVFSTSETIAFTTTNWSTAQTVTIKAPGNDANAMDETATLAHTAGGGGYGSVSKSLSVTIDDNDAPDIVLWHGTNNAAITTLPVTGATASYRVRLATLPTAGVTVTVTASGDLEINDGSGNYGSSRTLSFLTTNWDTLQTVTVRATADDDLADGSATLAHAAADAVPGTASAYASVSKSLPVTITDNDTPTIILSETALSVDEGGNATYTVKLSHRPAAGVTITITSSATDAVEIDGPDAGATFSDSETLSFTTTNWNTPQTVTVKGATDDDLSNDLNNTLTHAASNTVSSQDSLFSSAVNAELSVTVTDTTSPSIVLTQSGAAISGALSIDEEGSNVTYQVGLSNAPLAPVTVTITSNNAAVTIDGPDAGATFSNSETLRFNTGVTTAQTVTIQAPDDGNPVNESVTLTHDASGSLSGYENVSDATLTVNVMDDDAPNIVLSESMLTVAEENSVTVDYTVQLATQPTANVTVTVTASGDLTIDGPDAATAFSTSEALTFTALNWSTAQTIKVKAAADNDLADAAARIDHRAANAGATASGYAGISKSLSVTVTDDDTGSLMLSQTARTVTEGDDAGETYTVKLSHRPSAPVTVAITGDTGEAAATPASLTFNAANWNTAQTVTVTAVADADLANDSDTLTHTPSATGGYFATAAEDVTVTVQDTTAPAITFSESQLSIEERDNGTYTVVLDDPPADVVTVAIASSNSAITVNPATLAFTTVNYGSAQTVMVNTTADDDAFHDAFTLTHTPTIRGIASPVTLLPALLREPDPSESEETARIRITPPPPPSPAATSTITIYAIDTHTLTVAGTAGVPDGVTVNTLQSLAGDLTITFSVPPEDTPTTLSGFTLDGDTLVDIEPDSVPAGGLEICLPRGDGATQLLHYRSGRWQVVPGSGPRGDQVCGTVSEFSPFIAGQPAAVAPETEPERPPIIYNLNIRFDARHIALPEGHTASYRVRLAGRPAGRGATIRIRSDNPDVKPTPAELRFTAADWEQWQTVSIAIAGDANHTDESATLAHYGPNRGYGSVLVSVTDTGDSRQAGDTIPPALTVITEPGARWGVTVTPTAPADLTAHGVVRVSPAYGVPRTAAGYGLGRNGAAQAIVSIAAPADVPASGLTVCLPVARALAEEAGERRLTLLRYGDAESGGGWQAVPGAEYDAVGRRVCAAGVTEFGAFAAAYVLSQ